MSPPNSLPLEKENEMSRTTATRESMNDTQDFARHFASAAGNWAERIETAGRHCIRYGLVVVLLWIGGMKFTAYEAEGISGFVSNSPLMSWAYSVFSTQGFSALLGLTEVVVALMIAARPVSAKLSAAGSALAVGMFFTTLTFLFSTPGVVETSLGFPALSALPGQFLIKDFVLLGAALWTTGEALRAVRSERV
jgi:reactive chlorine resistance protein C